MPDLDEDSVYMDFYDSVNMQPQELEDWLDTEESMSVGNTDAGESMGHQSGRRTVIIKRTKKDLLTESDYQHMNDVVLYIHRHLTLKPESAIEKTYWRYELMNRGHDPQKSS